MNVKAILAASIIATAVVPVATLACHKPTPPTLPDPDAAVTAQMVKAKHQMKAFMDAANAYLDCISGDTRQYNAWIDEMAKTADQFNAIVRKYKRRMATT
ncbi:hypothetical protein FKG94_13140 [Exilibacterium tricleocarpae]|uniref:Uncharacterized protein n=1 Tax=Exilibacterium tricleocarpae TaxID=2591008 RepID=A0A545TLC1_9GAMM|nr:hypothetical protein [Exilibacterium tricleocarpae]TQV78023.1 hypothetical protein FKG94_13140 [Exilibacterium tricleocarpae]